MLSSSLNRLRHLSCAAALGLALGFTGSAHADASDDAIKRGVELRRERKDSEALAEFRRAYSLRPTARALAQAGLAEQALGRWLDAERDLSQALASGDEAWITEHRETLKEALAAIRKNLGAIDLSSDEPDVELWVDGALVAKLPYTLRAPAGLIDIELRAKGRPALSRQLEVAAERTLQQRIRFERKPDATGAPAPVEAPAVVTAPPPPAEKLLAPPPPRVESSRNIWPWVTLGGSVVLVAGGVTAHVVRERAAKRFNDDSRCFQEGQTQSRAEQCPDDLSTARTGGVLAVVGYAGGALLGGLTAYLFLGDGKSDTGAHAELQAGPEHALLTYGRRF